MYSPSSILLLLSIIIIVISNNNITIIVINYADLWGEGDDEEKLHTQFISHCNAALWCSHKTFRLLNSKMRIDFSSPRKILRRGDLSWVRRRNCSSGEEIDMKSCVEIKSEREECRQSSSEIIPRISYYHKQRKRILVKPKFSPFKMEYNLNNRKYLEGISLYQTTSSILERNNSK